MNPPKPTYSIDIAHGNEQVFRAEDVRLWARQLANKIEQEEIYAAGIYNDLERAYPGMVKRSMIKRLKKIKEELLSVAGDEKT